MLEYPTGKQANVFWGHMATGDVRQAADWRDVSDAPGVLQVWETEREDWLALVKESEDNFEDYKKSGLTGRLGELALFAHDRLLENESPDAGRAMLRPLGVQLLQKTLEALPRRAGSDEEDVSDDPGSAELLGYETDEEWVGRGGAPGLPASSS